MTSPFLYYNIGGPRDASTAGGGGGGDLGIATIWNSTNQLPIAYPTWASLSTISNPRDEDEAFVIDADGLGSRGYARYSEADGAWGLYLAEFATNTAMIEFSELIRNNCTATVIENGRTYRSKALTGPDAISQKVWIPRDISETTLSLVAFLNGDEADAPARLAHGFTDAITGGATITGDVSSTGYTRLSSPDTGSQNAQLITLSGAVTSTTKVYTRFRIKASTGGTASTAFIGTYWADGTNIAYPRQGGNTQSYGYQNSSNVLLSQGALRSAGSVLLSTDTWIEIYDDGRTVQTSIYRDGILYHADKRSSVTSASNAFAFLVGTISSGAAIFADIKDAIVITHS